MNFQCKKCKRYVGIECVHEVRDGKFRGKLVCDECFFDKYSCCDCCGDWFESGFVQWFPKPRRYLCTKCAKDSNE